MQKKPKNPSTFVLFRQGDILLRSINEIPSGALSYKGENSLVLAEGEATGHFHEIKDLNGANLFRSRKGSLFVEVEAAEVELYHPEHAPIALPQGRYEVVRQKEYNPEGSHDVAD